jgi:hypothetical protein
MLIPLLLAVASAIYPPGGTCDATESRAFRIESYGVQQNANWIVPRDKRAAAPILLPDPPNASKLYPYEFRVSPDEQWILIDQKQYHGANAAWLYERAAPFHYAEVPQSPFSARAWAFFRQQTHHPFTLDYRFIIRFGSWPTKSHSLLVSLVGEDDHLSVLEWSCYYDLQKHRFYLDDRLAKKNQGTITLKSTK